MKTLKGIFIFLVSLSLFAGVVPQKKLDNINEYINDLIIERIGADKVIVTIKSAIIDDSTQKLNKIKASGEALGLGSTNLSLELKKNKINLYLDTKFIDKKGEYNTADSISYIIETFTQKLQEYNERGIYKAIMTVNQLEKVTIINLSLTPISTEAISIRRLKFESIIPYGAGAELSFSINAQFNAKSDLLNSGQDGMTGVFTSLSNREQPKLSDLYKLYNIFKAIFNDIN